MNREFVIAHISDLHIGRVNYDEEAATALGRFLDRNPADFVVMTGDLSQWGTRRSLQRGKELLDTLASRWIAIPGNHDVGFLKRTRNWNRVFPVWGGGTQHGPQPERLDAYYVQEEKLASAEAEALATQALRACEYYPSHDVAFLKFDSNVMQPLPWHY